MTSSIRSLTDIIGQERPVQVLERTLATGRTAHAYLFDGISGCGKKTTALAFIKAIFCQEKTGCGSCSSCIKIESGQHPDLITIAPDGASIKIDQIRELQRNFSYHPYEAPKKACIIEDAEKMNTAAANALLKTLEEPPGNALLILLTSNLDSMLPTVLSRCQRVQFSPIPDDAMVAYLMTQGSSPEAAHINATLAGGSLEKALEVEQEGLMDERRDIITRVINLSLFDVKPLFSAAEEIGKEREKAVEFLHTILLFFRDVMLLKAGCRIENHYLLPLLQQEAARLSLSETMARVQWVSETHNAVIRNINARLALDRLFMRLASNRPR